MKLFLAFIILLSVGKSFGKLRESLTAPTRNAQGIEKVKP